jgi:MFS family permease
MGQDGGDVGRRANRQHAVLDLIEDMAGPLNPLTEASQDLATEEPIADTRPAWLDSIVRPIESFRLQYVPVVMVYFAYGALGLIDVSRDLWIKESLSLTPSQLAAIGVWLALPWTVKMVFGELVDTVPIFGSQRKSYILIGAALMAAGLLTLAGAASGTLTFLHIDHLYILGAMLLVIGTVVQDVVADAMSTEVVDRTDAAGNPRPDGDVRVDLGMVQVLGRLAVSGGILAVAGLSGWLAEIMTRAHVFLIALVIPVISVAGVFLRGTETTVRRPIDWRILGGGIAFGVVVTSLGVGGMPFSQEIIFVVSMSVVCYMLALVTRELDHETRMGILFTTIIVFAFRATPTVGDGFFWWTLDDLHFDAAFYGTLRQTGAILSIAAIWLFSRQLTECNITKTLFWIAVASTVLSLPNIALVYGIHHWTEAHFGFGARSIAFVDAAAASPFAQLSMVPLLTLIAYYAPPGHRATWFALMASLMNLALVASQLQTKYLNDIFVVGRGHYVELPPLLNWSVALGLIIPVAVIALFGRSAVRRPPK